MPESLLQTKKALQIILKVVVISSVNIPQLSSKIQTSLREGFSNTLGINENLKIKVEIRKIAYNDNKDQGQNQEEEESQEPEIPYRNYD